MTDKIHVRLSRGGFVQRDGRTVNSLQNTTSQTQVLDL